MCRASRDRRVGKSDFRHMASTRAAALRSSGMRRFEVRGLMLASGLVVWAVAMGPGFARLVANGPVLSDVRWALPAVVFPSAFGVAVASPMLSRQSGLLVAQTLAALLCATRELFAESTRIAERLRIARELHDSLGHHLTALHLQLELARRVAEGQAVEPIRQSRDLARDLLSELRDVVGAMREERPIDLARAIDLITAGIPVPRIAVTLPSMFFVHDHTLAHTLFRCVQESLTNAVRHAEAAHVSIEILVSTGGDYVVTVRDDGRGAERLRPGHGLDGLRERVTRLGGRLEIDTRPGAGFTVRAFLPARPAAGAALRAVVPARDDAAAGAPEVA
jgi:signal transduction histidine kinase